MDHCVKCGSERVFVRYIRYQVKTTCKACGHVEVESYDQGRHAPRARKSEAEEAADTVTG